MLILAASVGWVLLAAALCGAFYALAAGLAASRFFKPAAMDAGDAPPVTLFKPLNGIEPGLKENLAGFCRQDYAGAIQMVLGVQSADDPAIAIVRALQSAYPGFDIALVVDERRETANPKIANLINMLGAAKHDILVMSDADIGVARNYLQKVIGALLQKGAGAVTCCYRGGASNTLWSRLAAMGIDYQYLPGIVFGVVTGMASPCFGQTIALRRSMLEEIGGFAAFGDVLAEDFEIGRAVRARGYRVAIADTILTNHCAEDGFAGLVRHELRWAFTIRAIDPAGHAGSVITHMGPLAVLGAACWGFSPPALGILAAVLAARLFLAVRIDRVFGGWDSYWLLPLRDGLSFAVFIGSFFVTHVEWRGRRYRVTSAGQLKREP